MTAYAGFYVTPDAWIDWVRSNPKCPTWAWGVTVAQAMVTDALREKKMGTYFGVEIVPVPPSELDFTDNARGLMLARRRESKRAYIPQRPDSKCDLTGKQMLKELIGLEASEWKTMWYNELSVDPPYETKFLKPGARTQRRKTKTNTTSKSAVNSELKGVGGQAREVETNDDQDVKPEDGEVEVG